MTNTRQASERLRALVRKLQGSPLCFHQRDRGNNRTMVLHVRGRLQVSARRLSRVGYLHGLRSWLAHLESGARGRSVSRLST